MRVMGAKEERLVYELEAERDWRVRELRNIKLLYKDINSELSREEYSRAYLKMTVPMIYAHWEGYVVQSYKIVFEFINRLEISAKEMTSEILTYANSESYNYLKGKHSFSQKCSFTKKFLEILDKKVKIQGKIETNSNLKFEVFEKLLNLFGIDVSKFLRFRSDLNLLVNVRNSIAHGENSYNITFEDVERYIEFITELIDELLVEEVRFIEENRFRRVS